MYIYILNSRYHFFQWSIYIIYRCCNKHYYRVNSKHVQNFHIKNAIGQTGQTSVKLLLATHGSFWLGHETITSGILLHPLAVCGIWCLSHSHTLILISSWIRYYYILTHFVYASLLNQLETSDTHTSLYHHRPQQGLGATFPSEGNNIWHHLRQYCIGISTINTSHVLIIASKSHSYSLFTKLPYSLNCHHFCDAKSLDFRHLRLQYQWFSSHPLALAHACAVRISTLHERR